MNGSVQRETRRRRSRHERGQALRRPQWIITLGDAQTSEGGGSADAEEMAGWGSEQLRRIKRAFAALACRR